jgi:subfamily B ATP-binding cassette protein MsbA
MMAAPVVQDSIGTQITEAFAGLDHPRNQADMAEDAETSQGVARHAARRSASTTSGSIQPRVPVLKGITFTAPAGSTRRWSAPAAPAERW